MTKELFILKQEQDFYSTKVREFFLCSLHVRHLFLHPVPSPLTSNIRRTPDCFSTNMHTSIPTPSAPLAVPTFAELLTETIRLTKNKCTSDGKVVQECERVLPRKEFFLICVLLVVNLWKFSCYKLWYYIYLRVVHKCFLRIVSRGSRVTLKWSCCSGWNRLLASFQLAWTRSHAAQEVRTAWTSNTRMIGKDFIGSSQLNPLKYVQMRL